eukprot:3849148-Rhodomonas_salina.5
MTAHRLRSSCSSRVQPLPTRVQRFQHSVHSSAAASVHRVRRQHTACSGVSTPCAAASVHCVGREGTIRCLSTAHRAGRSERIRSSALPAHRVQWRQHTRVQQGESCPRVAALPTGARQALHWRGRGRAE